jgi:hypothetical protein
LSDHTDNRELEDEQMTRVIEPDARQHENGHEEWIESESEEDWDEPEEEDELPPRPRNRFLRPLPMALLAILIAAVGFLGGVEVQKGSGAGGGAAGPGGAGGLPAFLAAKGGEGSGSEAGSGQLPAFGAAAGGPTVSGTVTSVEGNTIYVKDSEGNTVAVKAEDGSTISRDSNVGVKKIHPGDSVVVQGSKSGSTVKASSISATEAGVETTGFGGGGPPAAEGGGGEGGSSVESLIGE